MTTINKFAQAIEEIRPGSAREFFRELERHDKIKETSYIWDFKNYPPSRMLDLAFCWSDTERGADYWREIHQKLEFIEQNRRC